LTDQTEELIFGVIGFPINHSLSPILHRELLRHIRLKASYLRLLVEPEELGNSIEGMRSLNYRGLNVTAPHKEGCIQYLDELAEGAEFLGAVNTISNEDGLLRGFNTDVAGFRTALRANGILAFEEHAVVFGAGGAAAAVCHALILDGVNSIRIYNRNVDRARALQSKYSKFIESAELETTISATSLDSSNLEKSISNSNLIIQATPVGTGSFEDVLGLPFDAIGREHVVIDLVYNPTKTRLLRESEMRGARIMNGLDMLIYQGIKALEIWIGSEISSVPVKEIKTILEDSINDESLAISNGR
jgi:shikimate dehydrogenase